MTEKAKKRRLSEEDEEEDVIGPLPVEALKPSKRKKGAQTSPT